MYTSQRDGKSLTAADVMTRNAVTVPKQLPAAEAAKILTSHSISGVPVVDEQGRCVGVFSTTDFARVAGTIAGDQPPPIPCPFQLRHRTPTGTDATLCTLTPGMCLLQRSTAEDGGLHQVCSYPHEIVSDWTLLQREISPTDPVERWMTAEPITIADSATAGECAAAMLRAHIHHLIVVDEAHRVLGILTSTNLLQALAGVDGTPSPKATRNSSHAS